MEELIEEIKKYHERFFAEAHFIILEESPFSLKIRFEISKDMFVEIQFSVRNDRRSYALIKKGMRIAGFDNFGGWHMHPVENPESHEKIRKPQPEEVFKYLRYAANNIKE